MKRAILYVAAAAQLCVLVSLAGGSAHALGATVSNRETAKTSNLTGLQGSAPVATSYIGIYADSARGDVYVEPAPWMQFDAWVWCWAEDGVMAAEYAVSYPSSVVLTEAGPNPAIAVWMGSPESGVSVAFGSCQTGWTYTHHLKFLTLRTDPGTIEIVPHPEAGTYQIATCELGYPLETPARIASLYYRERCWDDDWPPGIESIVPLSLTELEARYTEPVIDSTAENLANYYVCDLGCTRSIPITSVTLLADRRTIHISLGSPFEQGIQYFLGYIDIQDLCGNVLDWRGLRTFGYIPDLVISSPWAEPDLIFLNTSEIEVGYTIKNSGNWPSGPFDASILWYRGTADTAMVANVSYDGLAVGDSIIDSIQIVVPAIQTFKNELRCWVDYRQHVDEWSDANNLATKSIYVYLPDISISYNNVTTEPSAATDGCTAVRLRYHIDNLGSVGAGPFPTTIQLQINRSPQPERRLLATIQYPGLSAHATLIDSFAMVLPPDLADNNGFVVTANTPHAFIEIGYNNNSSAVTFANYAPRIVSIEDRPEDAGGFVALRFYRCRSDVSTVTNPIVRYDIISEDSGLIVGAVPATKSEYYTDTVTTIADSTSGDLLWSAYRVRAVRPIIGTPDTAYHYSCPDSGYSVDNRISTLLQSFSVSLKESRVELAWRLAGGSDTPEFVILRENKSSGGFVALAASGVSAEDGGYTFVDSDVERGESYRYRIEYLEGESRRLLVETEFINVPALPLTLYQNLPNPFNPATMIRFYVPKAGPVRLEVFDVRGSRVATLVDGRMEKGMHGVEWNGTDGRGRAVGSGIYFYRLVAGKAALSRKMILLR